ncbi:ROK family protein [Fulvivirga sediminis]|uniref:ROK family protein n=1 Tax=Fulvivirga sediminis TaxID=2803949 RepID=A0A937F3W4_9BACT|nr:ROK family protein [Fulvivirga sediminis]MBL3655877.1 ROK family protein [Fulvivirga sediminis]
MSNRTIVGVDIGGTSINIGLVEAGQLVKKLKVATPAQEAKDVVIKALLDGIESIKSGHEVQGIGIGVPGLLDTERGIVYDLVNIPSWKELHLAKEVSKYFNTEVFIGNDANCFVVGEKMYGRGDRYNSIAGVTLGTGLGMGFVFNEQLHSGIMSAAGEVGAIPYMLHNYEHYCSGKFFSREFGLDGDVVFQEALAGHAVSKGIFRQFGLHLGHLFKHLLHIVAPEAIFIGGSIKDAYPFFSDAMWEVLHTFPYKRVIDNLIVEKSEMNDVAIMGAAAVCDMNLNLKEKSDVSGIVI